KAVHALVLRHESLRSTFKYTEQGLFQSVADTLEIEVSCVDVQTEPGKDRAQHVRELVNHSARQPLDLSLGPLVRVKLFRLAEDEHILLVVLHHSISDGWSLALFFQELATVYDSVVSGTETQLEPLPLQYP